MKRSHAGALVALLVAAPALLWGLGDRSSSAAPARAAAPLPTSGLDTAVFAGGCFWGIEAIFEHMIGVASAESGYAGGTAESATYDEVSAGNTGHAESVRVVYDPRRLSYEQLLEVFFSVAHDPTQLDRQGPDFGPQYRSAIFYRGEEQRRRAESHVARLAAAKTYGDRPIVTQLVPLEAFYAAEAYHQNYMARNPNAMYIVVHDRPKVERLKREFPKLYKD